MIELKTLLGGVTLGLALGASLAQPAFAEKVTPPGDASATSIDSIDFGDDTSEWARDGECDDPRFAGPASATELLDVDKGHDATDCRAAYAAGTVTLNVDAPSDSIDFGDDTSEWAKDGECDDPRFTGPASAAELLEVDKGHDATDCQAAYAAGTVTLNAETSAAPANTTDPTTSSVIDFGDDTSDWAKDGECDDPGFTGPGSAEELLEVDRGHDATDCQAAYQAGTVTLADGGAAGSTSADQPMTDIDFGDDTSKWAQNGECDDPRFEGTGVAAKLVEADKGHDATDCRAALEAGSITLRSDAGIDFGDDASQWANDGECDDPRFSGTGVAKELLEADRGHDATDCRAALEAGTATFEGGDTQTPVNVFDYGGDWSKWANDGECDDLRFEGPGTDKKLLTEDMQGDASDCKALEAEGKVTIRTVYDPQYAAGAPYDSTGIAFGDDTSEYANDGECDDPRFEGPGTASMLLDSDADHDASDCRAAFEAGTVVLR